MKSSEIMARFDFLEWLILHPNAKEMIDPGWFLSIDDQGEHIWGDFRHREGKIFITVIPWQANPDRALIDEFHKNLSLIGENNVTAII